MSPSFEIRSRLTDVEPVKENGFYYFYVRIFLAECQDVSDNAVELSDIDYVIYELHPSFGAERLQKSKSRDNGFEIRIWTYGWFKTKATVIGKDGSAFELKGKVEFEVEKKHKDANGAEEFEW